MADILLLRAMIYCVLLVIAVHSVECGDVSKEENRSARRSETLGRTRRREESSRSLAKHNENYLPYWFCPDVACLEVPSTCSNVEYIVYEPEYLIQGQRVKVRCESCPYCLDMPANFNQQRSLLRRRRSVNLLHRIRQVASVNECDMMRCPPVSENCQDVRLTGVKSSQSEDRSCGHCPACYDHTVHSASIMLS